MKSAIKKIFLGLVFTFGVILNAQSNKSAGQITTEKIDKDVTFEDFRCERMTGMSLSEFKEKLVENCNLNKPFSSSLSSMLNEVTYFYCCQKKK